MVQLSFNSHKVLVKSHIEFAYTIFISSLIMLYDILSCELAADMYKLLVACLAILYNNVYLIINNMHGPWFLAHNGYRVVYQSKHWCMSNLQRLKCTLRLDLNSNNNEIKIEFVKNSNVDHLN